MPNRKMKVCSSQGNFLSLHLLLLRLGYKLIKALGIRGYGRATKLLAALLRNKTAHVVVQVHEKSNYRVLLSDPYWNLLLVDSAEYEPEVGAILEKVLVDEVCFLDCGANCGYWSLKAAELLGAPEKVVAIEAASRMFGRLEDTAQLNSGSFKPLHFAVDEVAGREVSFESTDLNHAGAAIAGLKDFGTEVKTESVQTASIDSIVDAHFSSNHRIVIKLDVEGNEIPALKGAESTFTRDALVIYEDLGLDSEEDITGWFLRRPDFIVFLRNADGSMSEVQSVEQVAPLRIKKGSTTLNLFACKRGSFFEDIVRGKKRVEEQVSPAPM